MRLLTKTEFDTLVLNESYDDYKKSINENIKFHIENELTISESIFRVGSEAYLDFVNEMRALWNDGKISVSEDDQFILEKLYTGQKGTYTDRDTDRKKTVNFDDPQLSPKDIDTLYYVYNASSPYNDHKVGSATGGGHREQERCSNIIRNKTKLKKLIR